MNGFVPNLKTEVDKPFTRKWKSEKSAALPDFNFIRECI